MNLPFLEVDTERLSEAGHDVGRLVVRALKRPEEERGAPRVLLDGAGRSVAGLGLGRAEHLREGGR